VFGDMNVDVNADKINYSTVFGDMKMNVVSRSFRGGTVSTVFGDTNIELSDAEVPDGEHSLKVSGVFGDATIVLPRNMAFSLSISTLVGEVHCNDERRKGFSPSLRFKSAGFSSAAKRLHIEASQLVGDVFVKN
jgi:predicted membrane protein